MIRIFMKGEGLYLDKAHLVLHLFRTGVIQSKYPISIINKVSPVSLFKVLRI